MKKIILCLFALALTLTALLYRPTHTIQNDPPIRGGSGRYTPAPLLSRLDIESTVRFTASVTHFWAEEERAHKQYEIDKEINITTAKKRHAQDPFHKG